MAAEGKECVAQLHPWDLQERQTAATRDLGRCGEWGVGAPVRREIAGRGGDEVSWGAGELGSWGAGEGGQWLGAEIFGQNDGFGKSGIWVSQARVAEVAGRSTETQAVT